MTERVGHVQVRGGNVMAGVLSRCRVHRSRVPRRLAAHRRPRVHPRRLLFVTGRAKEVLFVNGENLYAHDIEQAAMQAAEGRRVAVCAWRNGDDESDRLLVFVASSQPEQDVRIFRAIESASPSVFGLRPHAMIPLVSSRFPRTTSGKLQRHRAP